MLRAIFRVLAIVVLCSTAVGITTSLTMADTRDVGHKPGDRGH
ncbi:hypothetical protein SAMN02927914_00506 [Mesorhizobium qingshengii]|uniref:Uncharacterized protein n=1 Tax=Mesorhizobium qingshengii TaxID=1165689 RepID=A0A1G5VBW1_9HYPH|nr:hypothetical protein SAMN02927914_00506 [Mesorhizobium qingshengii]